LAEFQKLLQRNPENPIWHFNLGLAYLAKKKPDAARGQFEEAVKLNKNYVPPRLVLAEMSLERNAYPEALRYANEVLARRPTLLKAMLYRSEALMGSGNYSEARSLPRQGDKAKARAELQAALSKHPTADVNQGIKIALLTAGVAAALAPARCTILPSAGSRRRPVRTRCLCRTPGVRRHRAQPDTSYRSWKLGDR
jgi:tetratricopeptide (TPR) repeat protein